MITINRPTIKIILEEPTTTTRIWVKINVFRIENTCYIRTNQQEDLRILLKNYKSPMRWRSFLNEQQFSEAHQRQARWLSIGSTNILILNNEVEDLVNAIDEIAPIYINFLHVVFPIKNLINSTSIEIINSWQLQQSLNQMHAFYSGLKSSETYFISRRLMGVVGHLCKQLINEFTTPEMYFLQDLGLSSNTTFVTNTLTEWQSSHTLDILVKMLALLSRLLEINPTFLAAEEGAFLDVKNRLIPLWQHYFNYRYIESA